MAELLKNMKNAIFSGQGGGLLSTSSAAGDLIAENTDTRGGKLKKTDEASSSLGQFAKGAPGQTTEGTSIKASDQITNMQTGSADHLNMGLRKKD